MRTNRIAAAAAAVAAAGGYTCWTGWSQVHADVGTLESRTRGPPPPTDSDVELVNWSATHHVNAKRWYQPESVQELKEIVESCNSAGATLRPCGSGLSPNAIAFDSEGSLNMALLDEVVKVDPARKVATVQAGARVSQVVDALRPYGLTLQNYASIMEQQMGGFMQVGAHGTGATVPPVDEQFVSMKLLTPAYGVLELSAERHPTLFKLARVGLGALGVVIEADVKCVDAHLLDERTFVTDAREVRSNHDRWLREHRHLRYMWIPHTDSVVVVWSDPAGEEAEVCFEGDFSEDEALAAPRALMREVYPDRSDEEVNGLTFTQLRDSLIYHDPLSSSHIRKVNNAEAEYWKKKAGRRVDWSDKILGFDCGGQQWVSEVTFPAGNLKQPSSADLDFLDDIKRIIIEQDIPAPAPIEQRWSASSSSNMSSAWSPNSDDIFSWIGIIMYLPPAGSSAKEDRLRDEITQAFNRYQISLEKELWDRYDAMEHWAKIESKSPLIESKRQRLRKRLPLDLFSQARDQLDPKHILSNQAMEDLFFAQSRGPTPLQE